MTVNIEDYKHQIEAALKHSGGTHLFEDVAEAVIDGRMQMWVNGETVAITEVICYPRKKVLHVFIGSGKRKELFEMIESAWQWGQAVGCTGMTLAGRKGWMKLMGKFGFKPTLYVMEKSA
jgi:hypothetical protein